MTIPTRRVTVDMFQVLGTALPNATARLTLTRGDILADGSGMVPVSSGTILCDANGHGFGDFFPNELGTQGTQYAVEVFDEQGNLVFPEKGVVRAFLPDRDSKLHEILFTIPPLSKSDADAAVIDARFSMNAAADSEAAAAASAISTAADRAQTGADRIAVDLDAAAADLSNQSAQGFALTAVAQATLAATYAASAASVLQQDLSGAIAAALHRSPNTLAGTPQLLDWWNDTNPGWRKRMASATWAQAVLNGTWLGAWGSEMDARDYFGTLGATNLLTGDNTAFTGGVGAWASANGNATVSAVAGKLRLTAAVANSYCAASVPITTVAGQRYQVAVTLSTAAPGTNTFLGAGTSPGGTTLANLNMLRDQGAVKYVSFIATGVLSYVTVYNASNWAIGQFAEVDDVIVKPVDFSKNPSGAYYQLTTDGKYYRLWKNLWDDSEFRLALTTAVVAGAVTATAFAGLTATTGIAFGWDGVNPATCRKNIAAVTLASTPYTVTCLVRMDDGNAPAFGSATPTAGTNDFAFILGNTGINPTTYTVTNLGGGLYRVTGTGSVAAAGNITTGIWKYSTNSNRTFKCSEVQIQFGSAFDSYELRTDADLSQSETLSGNSADFPILPVAVPEVGRVVVYAADLPGRPMWRVFAPTPGAGLTNLGDWWRGGRDVSAIAYREGKLYIALGGGSSSTVRGLCIVDFAGDKLVKYAGAASDYSGVINGVTNNLVSLPAPGTLPLLPNTTISAVAATVMPDAPVEPATGLLVPTVAVASPAGVSVIKQDGTVVTPIPFLATHVMFDYRGNIVTIGENSRNYRKSPAPGFTTFTTSTPFNNNNYPLAGSNAFKHKQFGIMAAMVAQAPAATERTVLLHRPNDIVSPAGLFAQFIDSYNTGWMVGDIKRCFLASVNAGVLSVTPELVTDGTFDNPATAALLQRQDTNVNVPTVSGGKLNVSTTAAAASDSVYYPITTVPGVAYTVTVDVANVANCTGGFMQARNGSTPSAPSVTTNIGNTSAGTSSFTPTITFIAEGTATLIRLGMAKTQNDASSTWDNLSTKASGVADRSYRNGRLTLTGSVTLSAVALLAQLCCYGAFTNTNYLQEAYSADLDFAAGFSAAVYAGVPGGNSTNNMASWVPNMPLTGSALTHLTTSFIPNGGTAVDNGDGTWTMTNGGSVRFNFDLTQMRQGSAYEASVELTVNTGNNAAVDFCDQSVTNFSGIGVKTLRTARTVYDATFRFVDVLAPAGQTVTVKAPTIREVANPIMFERAAAAGAFWRAGANAWGNLYAEVSDGTTLRTITTAGTYIGQRVLMLMQYDSSGTLTLKINGRNPVQATGTPLATLANATAVLTVGNCRLLTCAWPGDLCLLKISATVPSEDAAAWVYDQERPMFNPGAQVTTPDVFTVVNLSYDPDTDLLRGASGATEWAFDGLVRVSSAVALTGSNITNIYGRMGVKLVSRTGGSYPGVDITEPSKSLKEELLRKSEDARRLYQPLAPMDWVGGFTANTANGSVALSSPSAITVPTGATFFGAALNATGVPAGASIAAANGASWNMSAAATATGTTVPISFLEFIAPIGYEFVNFRVDGLRKAEGATKYWQRRHDGFRERVFCPAAPGPSAEVSADLRRVI